MLRSLAGEGTSLTVRCFFAPHGVGGPYGVVMSLPIAAASAEQPRVPNCFLVVCALVSDLYCPGYNPRQSLEKNSNLARTAARNKIDSAKISAAVRAELQKAKSKVTKQSQPANKLSISKAPRHEQPK